MRANDEIANGVEDAENGDVDGVVRGGVYTEGEGVETLVLKWNHEGFSGVLIAIVVESVFHGEPGWAPDAAHTERNCGDIGVRGSFISLTQPVYS